MGLAFLATLGLAAAGGVTIYQLVNNFLPGKGKIKKDLLKLEKELAPIIEKLVPLENDELELLALSQSKKSSKKRFVETAKGSFHSIYEEPMITYALKKYVSSNINALLYARTARHQFIYRIKKSGVEIAIDNKLIGLLRENGTLYSASNKRLIGRIERNETKQLQPVFIGEKEVASLVNPLKTSKNQPRAFEMISKMSKDEKLIFLAISIYEMVRRDGVFLAKKK